MTQPLIADLETNIVGQLIDRISYMTEPTGGAFDRCRGVSQAPTVLDYANETAPAMLVQFRGEVESQSPRAPMGLPLKTNLTFIWWVHLLALSFGFSGEGRLGGAAPGEPGAYQMVDDAHLALAGFQVNSEHDDRMEYAGSEFITITHGRIVYVSKWRHRARRTGIISI